MPKEIKKEKVLTISIKESEDGGREIILNGDESLLPAISKKIDALIRTRLFTLSFIEKVTDEVVKEYEECEKSLYCMPSYTLPPPPDLAFSMPSREAIREYLKEWYNSKVGKTEEKVLKLEVGHLTIVEKKEEIEEAKSEKIFSEEKEKEEEKPVLSYLREK